uniref:Iron sulfur protein small subunit n=1 Tax=Rhodococcus aetherivorans TaxID=191292 RepID=Q8VQU5_9NOCA|nr:iron sulfur protein small subunit [Rhodococcus aetherivorans I24]
MIDAESPTTAFRTKPAPVDPSLQHEIEQFYYFSMTAASKNGSICWPKIFITSCQSEPTRIMREAEQEYSGAHEYAHFDDNAQMMRGRLRKITSDVSWSENPASRTRHVISNVMIVDGDNPGEYHVSNVFIVYRNRLERQLDIFAGERKDILRRTGSEAGFELAKRTILIDQSTILANNLSFFF